MVRLIDSDKMLKRIESWNTSDAMDKALYNFTLNRIIEQPTVDAVPVIRCKDCYFHIDGYCDNNVIYQMMSGDLIGVHFEPHEDFYCAMAERKEK